MVLNGSFAEEEAVRDLLVRRPLGEQTQDLSFPFGEAAGRPGGRNGPRTDPQVAQHCGGLVRVV